MTKQFKIISLIILFSFLLCSYSLAQQKETLDDLKDRVKKLEYQSETLRNLSTDIKEIKNENTNTRLAHVEKDLDRVYGFLNTIFVILIGIIVTNIGAYFLFFRHMKKRTEKILKIEQEKHENQMNQARENFENQMKKARENFDNQMNEKIENNFRSEEKNLLKIVEVTEEYNLKQNRSVLVLSHQNSNMIFIRKFFSDMRFGRVTFHKMNDRDVKLNDFDLILFNDDDNQLSEKDILDVISGTKATIVNFYFGSKRINAGEYSYKTTFANARVQLYGNLINALRYQSLLK